MMKRLLLPFTLTFLLYLNAYSQQPQNADFENWSVNDLFEEPDSFFSTNNLTYMLTPGGNVEKVSPGKSGLYSVKLTTILTGQDTVFGGLFFGLPGQGNVTGGVPYSDSPDSIAAYVKYDIKANDTANFFVAFKKFGNFIGFGAIQFTGTQTTWKRIAFPVTLPGFINPDTIITVITSSNLDAPAMPGSTISLDNIQMIGATQPFPNGGFENWTTVSVEDPDGWMTFNSFSPATGPFSVTKSTDSYNGTYAMRIQNTLTSWGDTLGIVTNGRFMGEGLAGGLAVSKNPVKVTGYYKYAPVGNDTALAAAVSFVNSAVVDSNMIKLPAASTYTYFEIPVNYTGTPMIDTLNIAFAAGNFTGNYVGLGSVLLIDNITVEYTITGEDELSSPRISVYPNPVTEYATFMVNTGENETYSILIYDQVGKLVFRKENIRTTYYTINKNKLLPGIYSYKLTKSQGELLGQGKLLFR